MSLLIAPALSAAPPVPLTHARIGYQRITGTLAVSGEAPGFPGSAANNALTYTAWQPDALPATWRIDAGAAVSIDYVGLAAHTLASSGCKVKAQYSVNDIAWSDATDWLTPTDDSPAMLLFPATSARYWRILIDAAASGATPPLVGVIYIGAALAMQRAIYGGHSPITLRRETTVRPVKSERGQWLGRAVIRAGASGSWTWRHLEAAWYRANFDPFVESARTQPFFIAWRPETFADVAYCWTSDDIHPSNMGVRDFMEVTLTAEGLALE